MDKYLNPISVGIDEQLITLCAVLSGYLNFPQQRIIIALIIMAFSNSLPDCLSYYDEKIGEKVEQKEAMKLSLVVFFSRGPYPHFLIQQVGCKAAKMQRLFGTLVYCLQCTLSGVVSRLAWALSFSFLSLVPHSVFSRTGADKAGLDRETK